MRTASTSKAARHSRRGIAVALLLIVSLGAATPAAAVPSASGKNAAVITTWNQIAVTTLMNTVPPPAGPAASPTHFIYYAFTHLAMHNAVNGITGKYQLYQWDQHANMSASPEAAAAAAAHRILSNYFPAQIGTLNTQLAASLAPIPDNKRKERGIAFGVAAANHIIALRTNDGRHAVVTIPPALVAGDWEPTPTAFTPFTGTAWIGGLRPLALDSYDTFDPGDPPAIDSATYVEEYNEVKAFGKSDSTVRTPEQSKTALFFSDAGIVPMQAALRKLATDRGLDISDSARLFAAVETSIADTAGTVWNAKLQYMWWRPVTAIQKGATDGNDATEGDATWMPFITTPPYPDWPSGLCGVVGSVTTALTRIQGMVDLTITSAAAGESRYFAFKDDLAGPAIDARVWSGIHFRTADEVSIDIGTSVANYVLDRYFAPAH
jgi:hypothetical protein